MDLIYNPVFLKHDTGAMHPEKSRRLEAFGSLPQMPIPNGEKYLELIHEKSYISAIKSACKHSYRLDPDTVTSPGSWEAAIYAVGAAILASVTNGFALVRPPGHHAHREKASGFCLFNNIAIAAQKLVNEGKRVSILDIDGHHGDGTASIFYDTDQVFYISLHQYPAYPGSGRVSEAGSGKGRGYTLNVPLPPHTADDTYLTAFDLALEKLKHYSPDIVGVSAGFDTYKDDPLLQLNLSLNAYYQIGVRLKWLKTPIFAVLEGGYDLKTLPKCVYNFIDGINGAQQKK